MSNEFDGPELGDRRLNKRLKMIVEQLAPSPSASFPKAAKGEAALEGTYRFLNHEDVTPERILAPHVALTVRRAAESKTIVVAHDTTELRYSTEREGLGRLSDTGQGFFAHFALALAADSGRPLGVLGLQTIFRREAPKPERRRRPGERNEGDRWWELVSSVEECLGQAAQAIHVMDREADSYSLFSKLVDRNHRFVIRLRWDHRIEVSQPGAFRLGEKLSMAEQLCYREVSLSPRRVATRDKERKAHPPRVARTAKLALSAVAVTMVRPQYADSASKELRLHVVHVREVDVPDGVEPIDWKLVTTEPIDTIAQLEAIVDFYRKRWVIEEFFKALKTGCAIEKRQLESSHALLNALAIFAPIAWQLLLLRTLARETAEQPASAVLSPLRIRLLQRHDKTHLCQQPTIRDAMLAIAKLGGHIKNNGDPGWQVLGRGFSDLLLLETGALLTLGEM